MLNRNWDSIYIRNRSK